MKQVLPLFKNQRSSGTITITDKRMTRFWLTLDEGVRFILQCIENMRGGEVFVPKIPSMRIMDLAEAVAPECEVSYVGIRPGEKLHEVLISSDEARSAVDEGEFFVIQPPHPWFRHDWKESNLREGFEYTSDNNAPRSPHVAPRIIHQTNDSHSHEAQHQDSDDIQSDWDVKVNDAWGDREKNEISGQSAAKEAAKVLGFQRLRDSIFPTLDKLLDASKLLKKNWSRNKNYVVKK